MDGLKNKLKVLITAGPTREYIDPVRYISNDSSGKMGYSLAKTILSDKNTEVLLISGPVNLEPPAKVKFIKVVSAEEMLREVLRNFKNCDILIFNSAVSDYKPLKFMRKKIKRGKNIFNLKLVPCPDILYEVTKKIKDNKKFIVGFALETENLVKNAISKLKKKKVDIMVANPCETIGSDKIDGYIILRDGKIIKTGKVKKEIFSKILWKIIKNSYFKKIKNG